MKMLKLNNHFKFNHTESKSKKVFLPMYINVENIIAIEEVDFDESISMIEMKDAGVYFVKNTVDEIFNAIEKFDGIEKFEL